MSFGLASAPSAFQQMMKSILSGLLGVTKFMDDIVVHAPTVEAHTWRLNQVLQRLRERNLTVNEEKCSFEKRDRLSWVPYLC